MCSGQWDAVKSQSERFLGKDTQSWHCHPPKLIKKKEYAEWLSLYVEPRTSVEDKEVWRKQHESWWTSLPCCQTHLSTFPHPTLCAPPSKCRRMEGLPHRREEAAQGRRPRLKCLLGKWNNVFPISTLRINKRSWYPRVSLLYPLAQTSLKRKKKKVSHAYYSTEWTVFDESGTKHLLCLRGYA